MPSRHETVVRIPRQSGDPLVDLALDTIARGKQALVFMMSKRSAEKAAEDLAKKLKTKLPEHELLSQKLLNALQRPTKQCERLAKCASRGVVFHHAGISQKQRDLIEDAFRDGTLRIIACTPTLAYGVNLPSFRTIIRSMKRYAGRRGLGWVPVLEYLQYAGRSGRPDFKDDHGEAILIASSEDERDELLERYVRGEPEEITSKLAVEPVLRVHLLSLIASGTVGSRRAVLDFFARTFWAHQYGDMGHLAAGIDKILSLLAEWGFVETSGASSGFVSANEVAEVKVRATPLGQRVAQLYIDPLTAHSFIEGLHCAPSVKAEPFSYLHLVSSALEMRPLPRVSVKEYELLQDVLLERHERLLIEEPTLYDPLYDEFLAAVKTACVLQEWVDEKDEHYLLETYKIRPGELKVKLDMADWLAYSLVELAKILLIKGQMPELQKLRVRLEYGAKEELLPLLRLRHIGRVRARQLFVAGFTSLGHIKRARPGALEAVLGVKLAASVREQLGQEGEAQGRGEAAAPDAGPTVKQSTLGDF